MWNLLKSKFFVYSYCRFHSLGILEVSCWGVGWGRGGEERGGEGIGCKQPGPGCSKVG